MDKVTKKAATKGKTMKTTMPMTEKARHNLKRFDEKMKATKKEVANMPAPQRTALRELSAAWMSGDAEKIETAQKAHAANLGN